MMLSLFISLALIGRISAFSSPSSDFLLGIDGSSVATGYSHVCALEQRPGSNVGGRAQCWGTEHKEHATDAPKDMDFVQLVAGHDFTCGLTPEQTVFCWGVISGYLPGLFEQITASSFAASVCGVLTDGKLYCKDHMALPPSMRAELTERFVQISCARGHCCALDSNAYPHCWGENEGRKEAEPPQITYSQYLTAANGPGVDMSILQLDLDAREALKRQMRANDEDFESDPNAKSPDSGNPDEAVAKVQFRQISVGEGQSCGITLLGAHLLCWGGSSKHPLQSPGPYRQVSVGMKGVCAITGAPEEGDANQPATPTPASPAPRKGRKLSSQDRVRTREGDKLHCWGAADSIVHYSGDNHAEIYHWDQVAVGATSVCAVTMDSELSCWGVGDYLPEEVTDRPSAFIVA